MVLPVPLGADNKEIFFDFELNSICLMIFS